MGNFLEPSCKFIIFQITILLPPHIFNIWLRYDILEVINYFISSASIIIHTAVRDWR